MKRIDDFLNSISMYRLVVYGLAGLAGVAILLALAGRLSFSPTGMATSLVLLTSSAYAVNWVFGRIWHVPTNSESWLITALILFLILPPADSVASGLSLLLAGGFSSASKFIFAWRGRHIFNPAALAAALLSLTAINPATWWIGSSALWPFTLVVGLAVVHKIRRQALVGTFIALAIGLQLVMLASGNHEVVPALQHALLASPLIFLASIMLTEPATMPPRRGQQLVFAALIAGLYATAPKLGPLHVYPEVALLLGNLYAFAAAPKYRARLRLREVQRISDRVYNYVFTPDRNFKFLPGQYMEWTLAGVPLDSRGNRRTLTIASSPTEADVQIGVKFYEPASTFKAALSVMKPGDDIYAGQLGGDFTLDGDQKNKLAFIAGGIGITPFRSMIKYLADTQASCDITLLYVLSDPAELAYAGTLQAGGMAGVKLIPVITGRSAPPAGGVAGSLDAELIARLIPDYAERKFYVSGPNAMVDASKRYLRGLGVRRSAIKTDHFTGY
jgi:ferredoxin-NADP reductase